MNKPAWQSTTLTNRGGTHVASRANDGDLSTVAATSTGSNWWYVDMQTEVWISHIEISYNNWELNHAQTANTLNLLTKRGSDASYKVCTYIGRPPGLNFQVSCDSRTKARFVKLENNGVLSIHDFRVIGYKE